MNIKRKLERVSRKLNEQNQAAIGVELRQDVVEENLDDFQSDVMDDLTRVVDPRTGEPSTVYLRFISKNGEAPFIVSGSELQSIDLSRVRDLGDLSKDLEKGIKNRVARKLGDFLNSIGTLHDALITNRRAIDDFDTMSYTLNLKRVNFKPAAVSIASDVWKRQSGQLPLPVVIEDVEISSDNVDIEG